MGAPQISIIIPVYNVEHYLCKCIDSIIAQTITDWECILVDDGSTDRSGEICDTYAQKDPRFRIIHQENAGSSAARNRGLGIATGEYVLFIDSDDWIDSTHISTLLQITAYESVDLIIFAYYKESANKKLLCYNKPSKLERDTIILETLQNNIHAGLWNKLIRREILVKNNLYFPKHDFYEDMYFSTSILFFAEKISYSSFPTYHYRVNSSSLTNIENQEKRIKMYKDFDANMKDMFTTFSLWDNKGMVSALYQHVNENKLKLLKLKKTEEISHILKESFPESIHYGKGLLFFLDYVALRFQISFPYYIHLFLRNLKLKLI